MFANSIYISGTFGYRSWVNLFSVIFFLVGWLVGGGSDITAYMHTHKHTNKHHTQKHGRVVDFGRILLVPVILCIYTTTIFFLFYFSFVVFFLLGFTICHSTLMLPYDTIHTHTSHISIIIIIMIKIIVCVCVYDNLNEKIELK